MLMIEWLGIMTAVWAVVLVVCWLFGRNSAYADDQPAPVDKSDVSQEPLNLDTLDLETEGV